MGAVRGALLEQVLALRGKVRLVPGREDLARFSIADPVLFYIDPLHDAVVGVGVPVVGHMPGCNSIDI